MPLPSAASQAVSPAAGDLQTWRVAARVRQREPEPAASGRPKGATGARPDIGSAYRSAAQRRRSWPSGLRAAAEDKELDVAPLELRAVAGVDPVFTGVTKHLVVVTVYTDRIVDAFGKPVDHGITAEPRRVRTAGKRYSRALILARRPATHQPRSPRPKAEQLAPSRDGLSAGQSTGVAATHERHGMS
jgi:hypothetical protein